MSTPNKVIFANFRDRRSYDEAVRKQKAECQGEHPVADISSASARFALMEDLRESKAGLGTGKSAAQIRDEHAARDWTIVEQAARRFAGHKTVRAAALRLEALTKQMSDLADQLEQQA